MAEVTLGDLRATRTPVIVQCVGCGNKRAVDADSIKADGALTVTELAKKLRCSRCHRVGGIAYPMSSRSIRQGRER